LWLLGSFAWLVPLVTGRSSDASDKIVVDNWLIHDYQKDLEVMAERVCYDEKRVI
jgi:hypothetical protein